MDNKIKNNFTLGGSVEKALSGDYELKVGAVLSEAWRYTARNLISFTPAIIALIVVQLTIFYIVFKLQIGDVTTILDLISSSGQLDQTIFEAIFIANFSYEVISAPIVAGVSLMAMGHTAGLVSKTEHILKGLQFTIPVILVTLLSLVIQGLLSMLLPLVSMYLAVAFSNVTLLVCEKRVSPVQALMLSFRAVNRKLIPILTIYLIITSLIVFAVITYGFLLVIVLPFFFHVKGIIYRNMFGIGLHITGQQDEKNIEPLHSDSPLTPNNKPEQEADPVDDADPIEQPTKNRDNNKGSDIFNA